MPINRYRETDENGNIIALNLYGFISTSMDRSFAEKNAYSDEAAGKVATLFVMDFRDNRDYWVMNQGAFEYDGEVVFNDGLKFHVMEVE